MTTLLKSVLGLLFGCVLVLVVAGGFAHTDSVTAERAAQSYPTGALTRRITGFAGPSVTEVAYKWHQHALPVSIPGIARSVLTPVTRGELKFQRTDYATAPGPTFVALGDFNGDGKPDLALANFGGSNGNTVSILLGNGDGTFQPHVEYETDYAPTWIAVGDFNKDGKQDLAVSTYCGSQPSCGFGAQGSVSILLGNGDGTFQPPANYAVGLGPEGVLTADFNGDNKLDLAIANSADNTISVLVGNGDGTFQASVPYNTGIGPVGLASGDFNKDGHIDLAVPDASANTVSVLLGNGNGTFQPHVDYPTGVSPQDVTTADFNGDGELDLAVPDYCGNASTCQSHGTVSVLLGVGDGTFSPRTDYDAGGYNPVSISTADVNGDGNYDLAVTNICGSRLKCTNYPSTAAVLLGRGDGSFQNAVAYAVGGFAAAVALGDIDGSGKGSADFAVAAETSNEASVLLNEAATDMQFASKPNPSQQGQPVTFTATVAAAVSGQPTPTGTVKFSIGSTQIRVALTNGVAAYTTSSLPAGKTKAKVSYSGDGNFNPNNAGPITQAVR